MKPVDPFRAALAPLALVAIYAVVSATAIAQTTSSKTETVFDLAPSQTQAPQVDEDERLDESFRRFGRAAGAAYQCAPEAEKERTGSQVLRAYSRIGQLFGTDRAFYFAAAFGNATVAPFDKAKCPELIKKLQDSTLVRMLRKGR